MWRATVGATPVNWLTWAASAIFSYGSRGTPCCAKTLKRVPELPNAHDGSSIRCARSAATTSWLTTVWLLITSASVARVGGSVGSLSCRSIVRGWRGRHSVPHVAIDFNYLLDITFTSGLLCAAVEPQPRFG